MRYFLLFAHALENTLSLKFMPIQKSPSKKSLLSSYLKIKKTPNNIISLPLK